MGVEIEKKYTILKMPENYESLRHRIIEQGYLNREPVVRIRKSDDDYYMTYKGAGLMEREEYNLPITKEAYEHLKEKADGHIIRKTRYIIPLTVTRANFPGLDDEKYDDLEKNTAELMIELDVFDYPKGLIMAEVEFPSVDAAEDFVMPDWFKEEVTLDSRYHNVNMAYGDINS